MAKSVDQYLANHAEWAAVLTPLARVLRATELEETIKWGAPVFVLDGHHVVGLMAFKRYAGLWFFDGALLDDPDDVLVNAQAGKTRGLRQWRYTPDDPVDESRVADYVARAIENARAGRRLTPQPAAPIRLPAELERALAEDAGLRASFDQLTPGRRREFAAYVAEAKREATRESRVEKILPLIRRGEGLGDRYRR